MGRHMLTEKKKQWARFVATGDSDLEAYKKAYDCAENTARSSSYLMRKDPVLMEYLKGIQKEADRGVVLARRERLKFLMKVIMTPAGELTEKSAICEGVRVGKGGVQLLMPSKLRALEILNKMVGEETPDGNDQPQAPVINVTVAQGGGDNAS